jgi:RNA methyltransferase, TrmH family
VTPQFLNSEIVSKFGMISNLMNSKKYFVISHDVAKAITREASPEGIIAEVDIPKAYTDTKCFNENILMLYRISDPGNLGTLLRTAKALNWNRVVLIDGCVDPFNPEAIRSSMGSSFKTKLQFIKSENLKKFIQQNEIKVIIADMNGECDDGNKKIFRGPVGLLLGSEANGFKGFPREIYDFSPKICIKMSNDTDSLNVAVCGGILMNNLRLR